MKTHTLFSFAQYQYLSDNIISDTFSLEREITLFPGDAKEFLKRVHSNSIMLSITSPPYNIGKEYESQVGIEQYLAEQEEVIEQLVRIMCPNGSICWQVGNYVKNGEVFPLDIFYYNLFKKHGLKLRNRIIWYFGKPMWGYAQRPISCQPLYA